MDTAQRTGLVVAAALALLIAVVFFLSLGRENLIVPTNGVTSGGVADNPKGAEGLPDLQARTRMQKWPETAANGEAEEAAPTLAIGGPKKAGAELTQQWLATQDEYRDILKESQFREGLTTLPGAESNVLVQPQGRTWRRVRNDQIAYGGIFYILGLSALIFAFLAWRGRIPMKEPESGETILRFSAFERANHWLTAVSFLLMAFTGLTILYGDAVIRPWLGAGAYADLAAASAWLHMAFAIPFIIGVVVMAVVWTRQNLPERLDWEWLKRGGGFLRDEQPNPPARRFNAGQKLVFWGVSLGGLVLALTGIGLMFPFYWAGYTGMQAALVIHAAAGLLMVGLIIGHIYIGTIGMVGAFDAMWSGWVDRNWAKEHHSLWYRDLKDGEGQFAPATVRKRSPAVSALGAGALIAVAVAALAAGLYGFLDVSTSASTQTSSVKLDVPGSVSWHDVRAGTTTGGPRQ